MRYNSWSNSPLADWIRGTVKPYAATHEEWGAWEIKANKNKVRYWLAETFLDGAQKVIYFPLDLLYDIKYYLRMRFSVKSHTLTSNLKRGQWYDLDTRILHCLFDELVNFVEVEQARMSDRKSVRKTGRNASVGTAALAWQTTLLYNDDWVSKDDPRYGKPTEQAISAKEILDLYHWWKKRADRPDPYDASGWSAYCEMFSTEDFLSRNKSPEQERISSVALESLRELEDKYEREDEEMLLRLIKVRKSLWT